MKKSLQLLAALISALLWSGCSSQRSTSYGDEVLTTPESPEIQIQIVETAPVLDTQPVPPPMGLPFLQYPWEMRRAGISGTVRARLDIDRDGRVTNVSVIKASHREFAAEVSANAVKCRFQPGHQDGKAVTCSVVCEFKFGFRND